MRQRHLGWTVIGLALCTLAMSGCSPASGISASSHPDPTSQKDDVTVAWASDLTSADPIRGNPTMWESSFATYETLLNYSYTPGASGALVWDGLEVAAGLAHEWEITDASILLHLREDARFYPSGNPVTADDVKWSFDRALNHPGGYGVYNFHLAGIFDVDRQVTVLDEHTLRIDFENDRGEPLITSSSVASLRFPQFSVIDSRRAQEVAPPDDPWATDYLNEHTLGSGPYFLESHQLDQEIVFAAVPDYYRGQPQIPRVIGRVIGEADPVALIRTGDIDLIRSNLTPSQLDELAAHGYEVLHEDSADVLRLQVAVDDERLADARVRQALAYAVPYSSIIDIAFSGRAQRATSFLHPAATGFHPAWERYDTDLERARELLDEAGVTNLDIPMYYSSAVAGAEDIALLYQESLAQIGVTLSIHPQTPAVYSEASRARVSGDSSEHTGITLSPGAFWIDDADVYVEYSIHTAGAGNWARFHNDEIDALHREYRFAPHGEDRDAAYRRIQEEVADAAAIIPLVLPGKSVVLSNGLTGYTFTPDGAARYGELSFR